MKIYQKTLLALFLASIFILPAMSQEKDGRKAKVKIVKEEDGKKTVIDTTFDISDLSKLEEMESLKELLGVDVLKSMNIDMDSLQSKINIEVEKLNGDVKDLDANVFVFEDGDMDDLNEKIEILMEKLDGTLNLDSLSDEMDKMKNSFIYEYEIESDSEVDGNGHKIIIKSGDCGKSGKNVMFFSDDEEHSKRKNVKVEIEEGKDGKKVIIKENGKTKEYIIDEDDGNYFIDEDGNVEKPEDGETKWTEKSGDAHHHHVIIDRDDKGNKKKVIVKKVISDEDETEDGDHHVMAWHEDDADVDAQGEQKLIVEVTAGDDDNGKKMITHKIKINTPQDEDYTLFSKAGISAAPAAGQKLNVRKFSLHPAKEEGTYHFKFTSSKGIQTFVYLIADDGKIIFKEKLKDFDGIYEKDIDLKKNTGEPIFMLIKQDDKYAARKIYVE